MTSTPRQIINELRRTRRRRRIDDLEWFEVLYKVYLVAIFGTYAVLFVSGWVNDADLTEAELIVFVDRAPAWVGLVAATGILLGARSGARGGPIAIEDADIRHLMLAPVSRRAVLFRPVLQRVRSLAGTGVVVGAIVGQLAGRRLPTTIYRAGMSGAAVGGCIALIFVAAALIAHSLRTSEQVATAITGAAAGVQGAAALDLISIGPFDALGHLAIWPLERRWVDLVAVAVVVAATIVAVALCGRMLTDRLSRRSPLVAQLRFAATLQDVRTVMLLRRQLSLEAARPTPWIRLRPGGQVVIRRALRSMLRFPTRRLVRLALTAAGGAVAATLLMRGTTPLVLVVALAAMLVGLELIEGLSQQLDQLDIGDLIPIEQGDIHVKLLAAPLGVAATLGAVAGATTAVVLGGTASMIGAAALVGSAIGVGGVLGAAANAIAGAPDPLATTVRNAVMPPEVAGMTNLIRLVQPLLLATIPCLPLIALRRATESGANPLSLGVRTVLGVGALTAIALWYVRRRLRFRRWFARHQQEAQAARSGKLRSA